MKIALFLMIFSLSVFAKTDAKPENANKVISLVHIYTSYVEDSYDLMIEINEKNEIVGIQSRNNKKKKVKKYGLDVLQKPIALVKAAGISLVTLKCSNFDPKKGADIEIEYPHNIVFSYFKTFKSQIKKLEDGSWVFYTTKGKSFKKMNLIPKTLLGVLLGVERVELLN